MKGDPKVTIDDLHQLCADMSKEFNEEFLVHEAYGRVRFVQVHGYTSEGLSVTGKSGLWWLKPERLYPIMEAYRQGRRDQFLQDENRSIYGAPWDD